MQQVKEQPRVQVRWMIRCDLEPVLAIEAASFAAAWTEDDFLRCLRQQNCIGMVAEQGEKVVGFMVFELHNVKIDILNFAVHPSHRRAGVGGQLVARLTKFLGPAKRRQSLALLVREANLPAQLFFRSQGFAVDKILRGFYDDTAEDACRFEYRAERSRS